MLTVEEVKEGLVTVMGNIKGNMREFHEIMQEIDKDGNGVIDYSEFIVAAVNKQRIISTRNLKTAFSMLDYD